MCLLEKVVLSAVASDKNTRTVIVSKFNYGCVNRIGSVHRRLPMSLFVSPLTLLLFTACNNTSERICPPGADPDLLCVSKESHEILILQPGFWLRC